MSQRIVSLMGGLGNQLFQLACAEWLRSRHGFSVAVEASQLGRKASADTLRSLEVEPRDFGFEVRRVPEVLWRVPARLRRAVCQEVVSPWDLPAVNGGRRFEIIRGYFQSASLLSQVNEEFIPKLQGLLSPRDEGGFVAVHVRLGDYTRPETARFHGVTSPEWLLQRAHEMSRATGLSRILVFSDSPELVKRMCPTHLLTGVEFDRSQSPLDVLAVMSKASGFVMSNSSLSWWGAYLSSLRSSSNRVVFPVPWLSQASPADRELLVPGWEVAQRVQTPLD